MIVAIIILLFFCDGNIKGHNLVFRNYLSECDICSCFPCAFESQALDKIISGNNSKETTVCAYVAPYLIINSNKMITMGEKDKYCVYMYTATL